MATVQHADLTGSDLHEPKGVSTAAANQVYVANGSGSGSWTSVPAVSTAVTDAAGVFYNGNVESILLELYQLQQVFSGIFDDVSSPSTVLIPIPYSCTILSVRLTLQNSISVSDSSVSISRSDGASLGSPLTVAYLGSAEGTQFVFTPTINDDFDSSSHKYLKLVTDGASTTACKAYVTVIVRRT